MSTAESPIKEVVDDQVDEHDQGQEGEGLWLFTGSGPGSLTGSHDPDHEDMDRSRSGGGDGMEEGIVTTQDRVVQIQIER